MAIDVDGLSPKQKAWCDEYIRTGNACEAARIAGYKYPKKSAEDNRDKQACKAYIAKRIQPTAEKRIASADDVMIFLSAVMRGEIKDQFGLDASLQDRIKAAQEINKRFAVADTRNASTMAHLDSILIQFRAALDSPPAATSAAIEATTTDPPQTTGGEALQQQGSSHADTEDDLA